MKWCVVVFAAAVAAVSAFADGAADPKKDPRRTYSTDGWKLEWSDEFDGSGAPDAKNWKPEVGMLRNHEPQYYTSNRVENCCVKDGVLTITARKEKWPNPLYKDRHLGGWYRQREFAKYTSADIQSVRTFHYGRVEFRAQMPGGWGAWPALSFLGDNLRKKPSDPEYLNWPACGEIATCCDHDPRAMYWRQMRNGMWIRAALIASTFGFERSIMDCGY